LILGGLLLKALFARGRRPAAESREADREVPGVT